MPLKTVAVELLFPVNSGCGKCIPIYELVGELDPARFWQVHRATLVNAGAIRDLARDARSRLMIRLKGCDEKLEVSRTYAYRFKQM